MGFNTSTSDRSAWMGRGLFLRAPVRLTEVGLRRSVRRVGHIDRTHERYSLAPPAICTQEILQADATHLARRNPQRRPVPASFFPREPPGQNSRLKKGKPWC